MSRAVRLLGRNSGLLLALGIYGGLVAMTPPGPPRLAGPRVVLPAHEAKVVLFAPGGRLMLTDGDSGGCLRDVATGLVLRPLVGDPGDDGSTVVRQISYPRFTPDGRRVVVQVGGPRFSDPSRRVHVVSLRVFDVATGRQQARFDRVGADVWFGSAVPPPEYALSADGSVLAFCRRTDRLGRQITAWDLEAGRTIAEFPGSPPLALSPDGCVVAFVDTDTDNDNDTSPPDRPRRPTLRRIRPARPARARIDPVPAFPGLGVGPVAFSNDGRRVAALFAHDDPVVIAVPPDLPPPPRPEATAGAASAEARVDLLTRYRPKGLRFSPDARLLFVDQHGDFDHRPETVIWDVSVPTPTKREQGPILAAGVAPGAETAVMVQNDMPSRWANTSGNNSEVQILHLPDSQPLHQFRATNAHTAAISPDGRWLAVLSDHPADPQPARLTRVFTSALGYVGIRLRGTPMPEDDPPAHAMAILLHDAATGRHVATIDWSDRGLWWFSKPEVEFSPDGQTLVLRTDPQGSTWSWPRPTIDGSVELWDVPRDGPRRWGASGPIAGLIVALFVAGLGFDAWRRWRSAATPVPAPAPAPV